MGLPSDHETRVRRARLALSGLTVADAFRTTLCGHPYLSERTRPPTPWEGSGDSEMVLAVVAMLEKDGAIDKRALADDLAARYRKDPTRDYDDLVHWSLAAVSGGMAWKEAAESALDAGLPLGDSAALRAAPVGAYFADDLEAAIREARAAASPTHVRAQDQLEAVAIAVAAAFAARMGDRSMARNGKAFLEATIVAVPEGAMRDAITQARSLFEAEPKSDSVKALAAVPHALWCTARQLGDYGEALWISVPERSDRDASGPLVGALVALAGGEGSVPADWIAGCRS